MWVDHVPIIEDGSLNGVVCHQVVSSACTPCEYEIVAASAGRGHPKHGGDKGVGMAGQDVYGHTSQSIYVADGHGKDGLAAALDTVRIVPLLENQINPKDLLRCPKKQAHQMRSLLVKHMQGADYTTSGATFTQMILVSSRGRRWVVTINIGDSEALLVYRNRVHVCSSAHVWESQTMYQRYVNHSSIIKPVCYNRWNASTYKLKDPNGSYRPMLLYNVDDGRVSINQANAEWISKLWERKNRPELQFGTQSVRMHPSPHENWGSSVLLGGRARGQNMATYGDQTERQQTGVPFEMVHVYVHEVPEGEDVVAVVQSDGVSNSRTLESCGQMAWCQRDVNNYLELIESPRDDMSVGMAYFCNPRLSVSK